MAFRAVRVRFPAGVPAPTSLPVGVAAVAALGSNASLVLCCRAQVHATFALMGNGEMGEDATVIPAVAPAAPTYVAAFPAT